MLFQLIRNNDIAWLLLKPENYADCREVEKIIVEAKASEKDSSADIKDGPAVIRERNNLVWEYRAPREVYLPMFSEPK